MPLGLAPALLVLALEVEPRLAASGSFRQKCLKCLTGCDSDLPDLPGPTINLPFAICSLSKELLRLTRLFNVQPVQPCLEAHAHTRRPQSHLTSRKVEIFTGHHLCTKHRQTMSLLMFFSKWLVFICIYDGSVCAAPCFFMALSWR